MVTYSRYVTFLGPNDLRYTKDRHRLNKYDVALWLLAEDQKRPTENITVS